jgi:cysteine-rich repeat protein
MKKYSLLVLIWVTVGVLFTASPVSAQEYEKYPILFVHGLRGWGSLFDPIRQNLIDSGYNASILYTIDIEEDNNLLCSEAHVPQVSAMVEQIVAETGYQRVDVIGHSRGGLNLYNYMRYDNGPNRVRNWVSIAGANQMCPDLYGGNPPADSTPGDNTLYTCIWSTGDTLINEARGTITGARNIMVEGVSHGGMRTDPVVFGHILEAFQGNGWNDGVGPTCANDSECDDGLWCTGSETCVSGSCLSSGNPCSGSLPVCDEDQDECVACSINSDCDDDNECTSDVCSSGTCSYINLSSGTACTGGTCDGSGNCTVTPFCGDGVISAGVEGCDDGDVSSGDGCSSTCQVESGWICSNEPSDCVEIPPVCGDESCNGTEICGTTDIAPECNSDCGTCGEYEKVPILLVHGWFGSGGGNTWTTLRQNLIDAGYDDSLTYAISIQQDNNEMCSEAHVPEISAMVEQMVAETGYQRVDVIGHSRGGLNLYNYMRYDNGPNRVRNWIAIAGAVNYPDCVDQIYLDRTPPADLTPGDNTLYTCLWSVDEGGLVQNTEEVRTIVGANNTMIPGVTHAGFRTDPVVFAHILVALQGGGLNDGVGLTCNTQADNNPCDGCVSLNEVTSYIDTWYADSTAVSMVQLVRALEAWKEGGC